LAAVFGCGAQAADTASLPAEPWYSPLKDIKAGPGKLDIGFNLRARYEYLDNFSILHYGTRADDDTLLLRTRLSFDYRFTGQAHTLVEFLLRRVRFAAGLP
jgi:hypothetical protein